MTRPATVFAALTLALAAGCAQMPEAGAPREGFVTALARALPFAVGVYGVARAEPAAEGGAQAEAERGETVLP